MIILIAAARRSLPGGWSSPATARSAQLPLNHFSILRQPDVRCRRLPDEHPAAVQADNGIIFNSLSEGNGTLTIGTTTGGTFTTSRPIAVGNEAATIDINGNKVD